ncbi:conserved hypothetical protein [Flavobacterium sp. 9AF]|uniref:HmuY family protein n=1 Tax=Flavobacterium sp. 9AF TaxID=2653142 RepID=UPI0012F1CEBA|nr:HmuY family protein [Flavobacterium sp. 9AF]VXB24221.1 conserved hypothetical protein [Flavobacterium sp. 9AF]
MKNQFFLFTLFSILFISCSNDDNGSESNNQNAPVAEAIVSPLLGGPNEQNQVYVDLSSNEQTAILRDSWDLGFSTDADFRVIINGSIKMAVKQTTSTDITEIQTQDASVAVGYSTLSTMGYVDNPTGILEGNGNGEGTAIAEISTDNQENKVYLVNLGYEVGNATPTTGSVAMDGNARGWKKIRITKQGNDYLLQYADLDATTAQSVVISKNAEYNFVFVSLNSGQIVNVQPKQAKWDLNFSGFTNYYPYGTSSITYYFSDFITTNILGGTKVYEVLATEAAQTATEFESFSLANVDETQFATSITDQRVIGSSWRNGGGPSSLPSIKDDRFYIIKDGEENIYKLRFLALTNDSGERGYPVFEYKIVK